MKCCLLGSLLIVVVSGGLGMQQPREGAWLGVPMPSLSVNTPENIYKAGEFPPMPILVSQARTGSADIKGQDIFQYVRDLVAISEKSRKAGEPLWGRIPGRLGDRLASLTSWHFCAQPLESCAQSPRPAAPQSVFRTSHRWHA